MNDYHIILKIYALARLLSDIANLLDLGEIDVKEAKRRCDIVFKDYENNGIE